LNEKIGAQIDQLKEQIKTADKSQKASLRAKVKELRQTKKDTRAKIVSTAKEMYNSAKETTYKSYNSKLNSMVKK
jgi:cell division septum initiation protein DivIVA